MAKTVKKAMVSGNSVAGKSFQMFTVSEDLLAKVVEAVRAGEKEARSSGNVQSFEIFCLGFRQNISLGRIMVVPPAVCNDRQNFPTALLHGCLVRVFGTGGEEIADLIEQRIGDSEFDEYSQADFDSIKKELFTDQRNGEEACLIIYAPNWMNSREYVGFHFSEDEEQLKNDLRHLVFAAYYNPAVSSAFNALMTNVNTAKIDVTDVTPKLTYPFLSSNPLKEVPILEKSAGWKKATILLNRKTADEVTKQTLDPQELDVFDSLNQALETSLMPGVRDAESAGEGGYKKPDDGGVPREASAKVAHIDENGICPGCKQAGEACSCMNCTCKAASAKTAHIKHQPGHKNSKGEAAPWCVYAEHGGRLLGSYGSKAEAKKAIQNMKAHAGSAKEAGKSDFPGVSEVAELFDVGVVTDIEEEGEVGEDEVPESWHTVYALGSHGELSAGLRSFTMTPYFDSMEKLEEFCQRHLTRFEQIAKEQEDSGDYEVPDATDWDVAAKVGSMMKVAYVAHCPGHKNSKGEAAPWCIKSHETGKIISSHKTKAEAKKHLQDMHAHSGAAKSAEEHEVDLKSKGKFDVSEGALHRALGIPEDQKIPKSRLRSEMHNNPDEHVRNMARSAIGLESMDHHHGSLKTASDMRCWNCGSDAVYPREEVAAQHPDAGRGDFICNRCGAAGDEGDFEKATADTRVNEYLRGMAAQGFEPVPETVEALKRGSEEHPLAPHETPFTNVGPGTEAAAEQENSASAMKESVEEALGKADKETGSPIGIAIDETGVPRSKAEERKVSNKFDEKTLREKGKKVLDSIEKEKAKKSSANPSNRTREASHPETLRVDPTRLSSAYSAAYNGGFVDKHAMPPQEVRAAMGEVGDNSKPAPQASADHAKQIEAGVYGEDAFNRRSNEKWGSADVPTKLKRSNTEIMASYIADVVAADMEAPSEVISTKGKQARAKNESLLNKLRPKVAVDLDIESIWDNITEDIGPAPLVEVEETDSNPAPSNTEPEGEVSDAPEAMRSDEPEDAKEVSESDIEQEEEGLENEVSKKESAWNTDSKYADFVQEVADEIEDEEELPRLSCPQCEMLGINGVPCHETGCPNMGARWDAESGEWVPQRECFECGSTVDKDDPCCSAPMDEWEEQPGEVEIEDEIVEQCAMASDKTANVAASADLEKKLNPRRFPGMSGKMAAIVGYILGKDYTDPGIAEMVITSDGMVLARNSKDIGMNDFIGAESQVRSNWERLLQAAKLSPKEKREAESLYKANIRSYKSSSAKKADTADNGYDIDKAPNPTSDETGPSETAKCHKDTDSQRSKGTDRPTPEAGAELKTAGDEAAVSEAEKLMLMEDEVWERLGIQSGGELRQNPELYARYKEEMAKALAEAGISKVPTPVLHELENENFHTLMALLIDMGMGKYASKKKADMADNPANERGGEGAIIDKKDAEISNTRGEELPKADPIGGRSASKKKADTADNPFNWVDGKGAPVDKKNYDVKDTSGPDAPPPGQKRAKGKKADGIEKNLAEADAASQSPYSTNSNTKPETTPSSEMKSKTAEGVEGDFAEARAEAVSPDTVDKDIAHPTKSVGEAGDKDWPHLHQGADDAPRKNATEKVALHYMNDYDIDEAARILADDPVLGKAVRFLKEFKDQVDSHSDGWAYWRAPVAAANKLMSLIEAGVAKKRGYGRQPEGEVEISDKALARAMAPIKAFMTRRGNEAGMTMPRLAADISGDMAEAKAEIIYDKAQVADDPQAEDTVNPAHFADDRRDDVPIVDVEPSEDKKQPKSDLNEHAAPEAHDVPPQVDPKKACGTDQPEEAQIDFGAGDLADIVMIEDTADEPSK